MDGLIIKQPYASLVIDGKKQWELRSRPPPNQKLKNEVFLLSSGFIFGKIRINDCRVANKKELEQNKIKHQSETNFLEDDYQSNVWEIEVTRRYKNPKKYAHPIGARVWVKDVSLKTPVKVSNFF